jgi:hypothetical protein
MEWTDDRLDTLRTVGDPAADTAAAALFQRGDFRSANAMLAELRRNDQALPTGLPPALQDFLASTAPLPAWADPALIAAGEALFQRLGPTAVTVLFCGSLPECYAAENGAHVLAFTQRLLRDPERRIVETAQFVIDVMSPGGLGPAGGGVRTTQKVRLMHAAIRHMVSQDPAWNRAWGTPINQEDLAGTLQTFSTVVLDGCKKLGAPLRADEERAYLHAWRVVGWLLGIREELLPAEPADARALFAKICVRQQRPSEVGRELTATLVKFLEHMTPGTMFDGFPEQLIHHLTGDRVATLLGVPPKEGSHLLLSALCKITGAINALEEHSAMMAHVGGFFARAALIGLEWVERGDRRITFRVPGSLRESWGLHPTA